MLLASKGLVSSGSCLYLFKRASYKVRLLQQSVHAGGTGNWLPTPAPGGHCNPQKTAVYRNMAFKIRQTFSVH